MGSVNEIQLVIDAARLLGRWALIAEKHASGCSCCPGLGDVTMEQVEGSVVSWLRERHPVLQDGRSVTALLRDCIARNVPAGGDVLQPLFRDLDEAFGHLEQVQRGL